MATKEELEKRIEKLEDRLNEEKQDSPGQEQRKDEEEISRRSFLKKVGLGTAGLGALALSPASGLQIKTNNPLTYNGNSVWHEGNDGSNSGLNADAIDGKQYSDIKNWVNNNADVPNADYADAAGNADKVDGQHASQLGGMDKNQKALLLSNL